MCVLIVKMFPFLMNTGKQLYISLFMDRPLVLVAITTNLILLVCSSVAVWQLAKKRLRGHFHHFPNKSGVAVMLSVFFPVWLAARASKREVFLTNYRPHTGVITSNSARLVICLPPVRPPLTTGFTEAMENCKSHEIHNSSHPSL